MTKEEKKLIELKRAVEGYGRKVDGVDKRLQKIQKTLLRERRVK